MEFILNPTCPACHKLNGRLVKPSEIQNPLDITYNYTFTTESKKTLSIYECFDCSHKFAFPLPPEVHLNYKTVSDAEYLKHSDSRRASFSLVLKQFDFVKFGDVALDIGCATGDFLLEAKERGLRVEGLELSEWSHKICQANNLTVHKMTIAEFSNSKENHCRFDLVTLFGVIEHFSEPELEMTNIYKILKPGGRVVIWTGDVSSITSKLMGRYWWYWQGQHFQYFTRKSMSKMFESDHKYKVESVTRYPFVATFEKLQNSLSRYRIGPFIATFCKFFFSLKKVWVLRIPGEMLLVSRKKIVNDNYQIETRSVS